MPSADELRALSARLRAATGPDRDLDAALHWTLVGRHLETDASWRPLFDRDAALAWDKACGRIWRDRDEPVPRLSASLDASIALAEAVGYGWRVDEDEGCTLSDADDTYGPVKVATPPLNVCAAILAAEIVRAEWEAENAD